MHCPLLKFQTSTCGPTTRGSLNGDLEYIYHHVEGNQLLTSLAFALTDQVPRDRRIWRACPSSYQNFFGIFSSTMITVQSCKHRAQDCSNSLPPLQPPAPWNVPIFASDLGASASIDSLSAAGNAASKSMDFLRSRDIF